MKKLKLYFFKLFAKFKNTFFTDCPRCHNYFFGNVSYGKNVIFKTEDGGKQNFRIVCNNCFEQKSLIIPKL